MIIRRTLAIFGVVIMTIAAGLGSGLTYAATEAQRCNGFTELGISGCHGYFANRVLYGRNGISGQNIIVNTARPADFAIPATVNTPAEFINYIIGAMGVRGTNYTYNKAGAAFLVDTMLGVKGGTLGNATNAIAYAQTHLSQWEAIINFYGGPEGRADGFGISWNVNTVVGPGQINSLHACPTSVTNSACTLTSIRTVPADDAKEFAWFNVVAGDEPEVSHEIVFTEGNGSRSVYRIRRECANLIGIVNGLKSPPNIAAVCDGFVITPTDIDPNTKYTITARISYNTTANATTVRTASGTTFYLKTTDSSGNVTFSQNLPITQSGTVLSVTGSNLGPTGAPGRYFIFWGIRSSFGNADCGGNGTVKGPGGTDNPPKFFDAPDLPYFSVTGGDAVAGAKLGIGGVDCAQPADTKASIVSWNRDNQPETPGYGGAGTSYAALALNHLQDFVTGQNSGLVPSGLSFANTSDGDVQPSAGLFGGKFDAPQCVKDYYATKPADAQPLSAFTGTPGLTGSFFANGPTTLPGTSIGTGDHITIYVNGDLYISNNVSFLGDYASVADIPSLTVIAKGSIYIAPSVTQLDGVYIAEPTSSTSGDGNIYTCSTNGGSGAHPYSSVALGIGTYDACNTQLTVNGSFVANQVWLLRTFGTLSTQPAETFNFTPRNMALGTI